MSDTVEGTKPGWGSGFNEIPSGEHISAQISGTLSGIGLGEQEIDWYAVKHKEMKLRDSFVEVHLYAFGTDSHDITGRQP